MLSREIYLEVLKEYESLSNKVKILLEDKKQVLYKTCPRIKEIDDEINLTCSKLSRAIISVPKEDKQNYINEIKNLSQKLKNEKTELMLKNGFFTSYFDDVYICKKCKDTGFINNVECECFRQNLINKYYNLSNLADILKTDNFKTFNIDYYSKEINEKDDINMSPFENMSMVMRKISNFIEEFDNSFKNILFYGPAGVGKTFLCSCIAKEMLDRKKTVIYITAVELFNFIEKEHFKRDTEYTNNSLYKYLKNTLSEYLKYDIDLLIIDDLGTEFLTNLSKSELFNIINTRILNKKATIISTNMSPEKLMSIYSSRIISRFYGEYDIIKIYGEDIRFIKKFNKK